MTRFIHVGDLHLGPNARNADRLRALDQILEESDGIEQLGAWLIPGDLNHARMTIEDRNALASRLTAMALRAPVLICYGNHDLPGDLNVFSRLRTEWPVLVFERPTVHTLKLATGAHAAVFVLPYPTEAGLVSMGVGPAQMVQTAYEALQAIFRDAAAQLQDARARGDLTLAIGHVNVAGAITSTGQPNIGAEIEIDKALIQMLGVEYVGLNHIHKGQFIDGAWYPGSVCRLDWGEVDPKRYLVITYREDGTALVDEHPIDVAGLYHVEGHLHRDRFDWRVTNGPDGAPLEPPTTWKGCEVRVRARFYQSEKNLLEMAKAGIFANFADAKRFELELIAVPDRALRAPEVAAAKTLEEKVAAWARATKTTVPERVVELLPSLEHGDPDAVVIETQKRIEALVSPAPAEREEAVA